MPAAQFDSQALSRRRTSFTGKLENVPTPASLLRVPTPIYFADPLSKPKDIIATTPSLELKAGGPPPSLASNFEDPDGKLVKGNLRGLIRPSQRCSTFSMHF